MFNNRLASTSPAPPTADRQAVARALALLQQAYDCGEERPDLRQIMAETSGKPLDVALLAELAEQDLEIRRRAGKRADASDYLAQYPELASNPSLFSWAQGVPAPPPREGSLTPGERVPSPPVADTLRLSETSPVCRPAVLAPLEAAAQLDRLCERFETEFRLGRRPTIDQYLQQGTGLDQDKLLGELLHLEVEYRRRLGESPTLEDYLPRFRGREKLVREALAADAEPAAGAEKRLGNYEVRELLGSGAFGSVYRCWDPKLRREVAVKVPKRQSQKDQQRFLEEAQRAARLRHENLVPVFSVGMTDDGRPLIVYEYVEGEPLNERLQSGQCTHQDAIRWLIQTADALHAAHRGGLVHRDVKPANILIDREGNARLTDFGLARSFDSREIKHDAIVGTLAYMSPEQASRNSDLARPQADVYSLGVILYQVLTGRLPIEHSDAQTLMKLIPLQAPVAPSVYNPKVLPQLEAICLKALEKDPARRYQTAQQMAQALRTAIAPRPPILKALAVAALAVTIGLAGWMGGPAIWDYLFPERLPAPQLRWALPENLSASTPLERSKPALDRGTVLQVDGNVQQPGQWRIMFYNPAGGSNDDLRNIPLAAAKQYPLGDSAVALLFVRTDSVKMAAACEPALMRILRNEELLKPRAILELSHKGRESDRVDELIDTRDAYKLPTEGQPIDVEYYGWLVPVKSPPKGGSDKSR
jgi:serine/threonine protein kinase